MATPRPQRSLLLILGMIATVLLGWVLHVGADIIQPLVIALLLGSMLQPVVSWLAKRHIPPAVTVLLLVSGLFFGLLQVGLIVQSNVRAFLGEAATSETVSVAPEAAPAVASQGETAPPDNGDMGSAGTAAAGTSEPGAGDAGAGAAEGSAPATALAGDGSEAEAGAPSTASDGAGQDEPLLEGPLTEIFDRQQTAMEESGGWAGIKAGIRGRIERAAQLPEEMRTYALKIWDEFDPSGLAENLAVSGYGFVKSLVLVLIYMVFIFAESAIFRRKILTIAGERQTDAAEILDRIGRGIQRYLGVKTVVSFLTGSLCYLVMVALDIPYAAVRGHHVRAQLHPHLRQHRRGHLPNDHGPRRGGLAPQGGAGDRDLPRSEPHPRLVHRAADPRPGAEPLAARRGDLGRRVGGPLGRGRRLPGRPSDGRDADHPGLERHDLPDRRDARLGPRTEAARGPRAARLARRRRGLSVSILDSGARPTVALRRSVAPRRGGAASSGPAQAGAG